MFSKLTLLALVAPLVSALTLEAPQNPTSGGTVTIKWTSAANDPATFSIELINVAFNKAFAIANNVNPTAEQLTLTLPIIPVGDGYTLQAVDIGNINNVFSTSPDFSVGAVVSSSTSSTVSSTSASATSRSASSTVSVTGTSSIKASSTSNSLVSPSPSSSQTSPAVSSVSSSSPSASANGTATTFNSGAFSSSHFGATGIAALLVSVAAGAAAIAL